MDEQDGDGPVHADRQQVDRAVDLVVELVDVVGEREDEGNLEQLGRLEGERPEAQPGLILGARGGALADQEGEQHEPVHKRHMQLPEAAERVVVEAGDDDRRGRADGGGAACTAI